MIGLNATAGVAALGGMWYALAGAPDVPIEWLEGSPFESYRLPGVFLGCVYAPLSLTAAWALWRRSSHARELALTAGAVQVAWVAVQVSVIGPRSFLQPAMAAVGVVDFELARRRAPV